MAAAAQHPGGGGSSSDVQDQPLNAASQALLDALHKVLETKIRLRRGIRVTPPSGMDADGAHESAKVHLLHGAFSGRNIEGLRPAS